MGGLGAKIFFVGVMLSWASPSLATQTRLAIAGFKTIESVQPYEGQLSRPELLDDLVYESFFTPDPLNPFSGVFRPQIATAMEWNDDFTVLTFTLSPNVHFQDSTSPLSASDIAYSIQAFRETAGTGAENFENWIQEFTIDGPHVRFRLRSAAPRPATARLLAGIKVVRPREIPRPKLSGISLDYLSTGPYKIAQLGPAKMVLLRDRFYWNSLPQTAELFQFSSVEVTAYADSTKAEEALASGQANLGEVLRVDRIETVVRRLQAQNANLVHRRELNARAGLPLSSLTFNRSKAALQQATVRQALFLAYDFEKINRLYFNGSLVRPDSLADFSSLAPQGLPTQSVLDRLNACGARELPPPAVFQDPASYGHRLYRRYPDDRARLLEASRLLQLSGYRIVNGNLVRDGQVLRLKILFDEAWLVPALETFQETLSHMGIQVELVGPKSKAEFASLRDQGDFDLISGTERIFDRSGLPQSDLYRNPFKVDSICLDENLRRLDFDPDALEAAVRMHQALYVSIFTGESRHRDFLYDRRIEVPAGASIEGAAVYGRWLEAPRGQP